MSELWTSPEYFLAISRYEAAAMSIEIRLFPFLERKKS